MPWQTIPGIIGKVYVPESRETGKKHPCPGCFSCQNCGSDRCHLCRLEKDPRVDGGSCSTPKETLS